MARGHVVDANTVALWRFDETTHQDFTTAADETGNYDATQTTAATKPGITGGPAGTDRARWFSGAQGMDFTPDAAMSAALVGDWTWEAWIYIDQFSGTDTWFDIGGSGETEATNFLARIQILATGFLQLFWEHSSGTNVTVTQAAGTAVSLRTWTYVAITAQVNGANRDVSFFVDSGTAQDTGSGTNASGGTSVTGAIGYETTFGADIFGAIGRIRLSNVVRTGTELNNNATSTTKTFANDGSTLALWDFEEAPEIADVSGNGHHLTPINKSSDQPLISESLLRTDGGQARTLFATNQFYVAYYREQLRTMLLGEWTIEWWGVLLGATQDHGICRWGQGGTVEANNYLIGLGFEPSGGGYVLDNLWEEGPGNNVTFTGTVQIVSDNTEGSADRTQRHHYAVVFEDVTGTTRNILTYRDGVLMETIGPITKPTGGTNPGATNGGLNIGAGFNAGEWDGLMDDMRLSNVARSATEILASYQRGSQTVVRSIPALPRTT